MASVDKRELILLRIMALLDTLKTTKAGDGGLVTVARDRGEVPPAGLPCGILLDGKEELLTDIKRQQFTAMPPAYFTMLVQVFVIMALRDNVDNLQVKGKDAPVGPEISAWRNKLLKSIAKDSTLEALCSPGGQIEYRGCYTDMEAGAPIGVLGAQIGMQFAFTYMLNPDELP